MAKIPPLVRYYHGDDGQQTLQQGVGDASVPAGVGDAFVSEATASAAPQQRTVEGLLRYYPGDDGQQTLQQGKEHWLRAVPCVPPLPPGGASGLLPALSPEELPAEGATALGCGALTQWLAQKINSDTGKDSIPCPRAHLTSLAKTPPVQQKEPPLGVASQHLTAPSVLGSLTLQCRGWAAPLLGAGTGSVHEQRWPEATPPRGAGACCRSAWSAGC